jgi:Ser/Thr protein kinase RdoA (MazF antagonist)
MYAARPAQSDPTANLDALFPVRRWDPGVAAVLSEYSIAPAVSRVEPLVGHGGLSGARLWRVETPAAAFVLREWPEVHPRADRLRFIHSVLAHAVQKGINLLAVPVPTRSGETFVTRQGRLWELAPWLAGEASFDREPTAAKIANAMRALAQFHIATADFASDNETRSYGVSPALEDRAQRLEELEEQRIASLGRVVISGAVSPAIDQLARKMLEFLPCAVVKVRPIISRAARMPLALQPCLHDIWHGNLLFSGDDVTGIVDFGLLYFDTPAVDVARLLGSMARDDPEKWRNGLAMYAADRPLSTEESAAIRAADTSGIVLGCVNWLEWLYVERRRFTDLKAVELRMKSLVMRLHHLAGA